jgi:poly(3-hydroxybutyrate) depolymerase
MAEPLLRHATAPVHGRYLVQPPSSGSAELWFVGFHGYAQSAALFLPDLARAASAGSWLVASVQALHPFYTKRDEVVANWMTREDRELAIADNIGYVDAVGDALEREFGAPRAIVFAGFSQGVAMAWRAAMKGRRSATAIVTAGGDVAPDVLDATRPWPRVLMLTAGSTRGTRRSDSRPRRRSSAAVAPTCARRSSTAGTNGGTRSRRRWRSCWGKSRRVSRDGTPQRLRATHVEGREVIPA